MKGAKYMKKYRDIPTGCFYKLCGSFYFWMGHYEKAGENLIDMDKRLSLATDKLTFVGQLPEQLF